MKYILVLFSLFVSVGIIAQHGPPRGSMQQNSKIKGKINGTVTSVDGAVEFATVVLLRKHDNKEVDGTITDEKGRFKITDIAMGSYQLYISFIGYEELRLDDIVLTPGKTRCSAGRSGPGNRKCRSG